MIGEKGGDQRHDFGALDGFRGIAALCVAFGHGRFLAAGAPMPFFAKSYLAVDFFFLLSGFVLEHAYGGAFRAGLGRGRFLALRLIRLYPLYLLALLLSAALALVQGAPSPAADWLFAAVLLPSPASPDYLFPLNIPAWSLFFELVANAGFALFGRHLRTPVLAAIVVLSGGLLAAAVACHWWGFGAAEGPVNVGLDWSTIGGGLLRVTFSFFAGVLLYRWRFRQGRVPTVVPAVVLLAVLAATPYGQAFYDLAAVLLLFPVLLLLGAAAPAERRWVPVWRWLGAVSFGVYVLQMFAYTLVRWLGGLAAGGTYPGLPGWGVVAIVAVLAIVAGLLDAHYDQPIRRRLKALMR